MIDAEINIAVPVAVTHIKRVTGSDDNRRVRNITGRVAPEKEFGIRIRSRIAIHYREKFAAERHDGGHPVFRIPKVFVSHRSCPEYLTGRQNFR